eukprot:jgi/Orpsp1_1/1174773/evm.model.c7180000051355.1
MKVITEYIKNSDIENLKDILDTFAISSKTFKRENFDILCYAVKYDLPIETIEYIFDICKYESYNYYYCYKKKKEGSEKEKIISPLINAIKGKSIRLIRYLIKKGIDINTKYNDKKLLEIFIKEEKVNLQTLLILLKFKYKFEKEEYDLLFIYDFSLLKRFYDIKLF